MTKQDTQLKILIIDDDSEIRYALKAVFKSQDWDTAEASNVMDGVERFRQYHPDIVLIDYYMAQINGIRGVELIRREDANVPLIVFTIDDNPETVERFMQAGATDFVLKPVKALDLIARIRLHIRLLNAKKEKIKTADSIKGIGASTLERIENYMRTAEDLVTVEDIAENTGLSEQTTYRYLQYLIAEKRVEVNLNYGKVGRPKQNYRLLP